MERWRSDIALHVEKGAAHLVVPVIYPPTIEVCVQFTLFKENEARAKKKLCPASLHYLLQHLHDNLRAALTAPSKIGRPSAASKGSGALELRRADWHLARCRKCNEIGRAHV